jgi:uncharacterized protein YbbC (DUF1343 family)
LVRPGLELLCDERRELVQGARVGLLAHAATVDRRFAHALELLESVAGARVVRLFAPEHGLAGGLQDMEPVHTSRESGTGVETVSLYGETEESLTPPQGTLEDLDALVIDLQDVGSRYYTFAATAVRVLAAAAQVGLRVVVADRPNPIGGVDVEGNLVSARFHSFVGELAVANRHALTLGELCLVAKEQRGLDVELEIVKAEGWRRRDWHDGTGLPWILPSPNMPTIDAAIVYPGACLVEGTNLSEGRGTTRPFELVGAPWIDGFGLAARLEDTRLPGARFRPVAFVPKFQKHAGETCGGVQIHVTDRMSFRPVLTGLALVIAARAIDRDRFVWRTEPYEFVEDIPAFDLLAGTDVWRLRIEEGASAREIATEWGEEEAKMRELLESVSLYAT